MKTKFYTRTINRVNRNQGGFTVPEVLIAMLVVGTITIAMFGALSSGFRMAAQSRESVRATQILMQKVEDVRLCTLAQLPGSIQFAERFDPARNQGALYTGTISTTPADVIPDIAAYKADMRLVTVTVSWTNQDRGSSVVHSRQMQTLVAQNGLHNYVYGK